MNHHHTILNSCVFSLEMLDCCKDLCRIQEEKEQINKINISCLYSGTETATTTKTSTTTTTIRNVEYIKESTKHSLPGTKLFQFVW
ncbi:CLUMA_CG007180, isoform A [Clunio marinus]|uniref:CLUMA_CG007180, isoform A n=1 Tax=Clunio marinus TaxID=568069 RepID=A0A1J1I0C8_9DIPT|nr:CLUMA_CG007180, isoform A [Clunio marinus]